MRLFLLFLGIAFLHPGVLAGQESPAKVSGVVTKLDVKVGTISIRPSKGALEGQSFSFLKKDIDVITPSGQKAGLNAMRIGHTVQLSIGPTGDVEAVVIQAPTFLATISDVDPEKRTLNILEGNQTSTMSVAADAKIFLAGRPAFLREIKSGSQMTVTTSLDGKTAVGMNLVADPDGKLANKLFPRVKSSRLPGNRLVGVVTDVDPAKGEIHFAGPKTKGVVKSFPLAKDALIQVLYGEVALQKLSLKGVVKQSSATILVSAENEVTRLLVKPPTVRAMVKAMDGNGGRLTVAVDRSEKTFLLRRDLKVMNGTRVMRLVDLQPNLELTLVLSLDQQQLLAVDMR